MESRGLSLTLPGPCPLPGPLLSLLGSYAPAAPLELSSEERKWLLFIYFGFNFSLRFRSPPPPLASLFQKRSSVASAPGFPFLGYPGASQSCSAAFMMPLHLSGRAGRSAQVLEGQRCGLEGQRRGLEGRSAPGPEGQRRGRKVSGAGRSVSSRSVCGSRELPAARFASSCLAPSPSLGLPSWGVFHREWHCLQNLLKIPRALPAGRLPHPWRSWAPCRWTPSVSSHPPCPLPALSPPRLPSGGDAVRRGPGEPRVTPPSSSCRPDAWSSLCLCWRLLFSRRWSILSFPASFSPGAHSRSPPAPWDRPGTAYRSCPPQPRGPPALPACRYPRSGGEVGARAQ